MSQDNPVSPSPETKPIDGLTIRNALMVGLLSGPVGFGFGLAIVLSKNDSDYYGLPVVTTLVTSLTVFAITWYFVVRAQHPGVARATLTGGLIGVVSHYTYWLAIIYYRLGCTALGGCLEEGEPLPGPLEAIYRAAEYSLGSLIFLGWVTIPLGLILGWRLSRTRLRYFDGDDERGAA